ncbi:MAG TPA: tetratricopeptide repeat protein [Opitutaceae bacterium]|nr:tetratricopeptide repeat protein [Opitutaceae bacterium]
MITRTPARTALAPGAEWIRSAPVWLCAAVLGIAIILAYAGSLRVPFLFDDADAVVKNSTIRHFWSWEIFQPPSNGSTTTGRPLLNAGFALSYALSGDRPWSYHALNVALHACAALLLFGLVRRTAVRAGVPRATSLAFAVAGLWALHPLGTETIVCVAQRTELQCGFFYLLTLYCFARGVDDSAAAWRWHSCSVLACLAGMATKEVMVTAPLLVLLYDRTFVARSFSGAWRARRGYYAALAGTWLLLAALVVGGGGARGVAAGFGRGVSAWSYLLTQCEALVVYLRLALWPHPLVLDYGNAVVSSLADVWWQGLTIVVLLGLTIWALARRPVAGFFGACFFAILAPSSSVVPLVTQTIAEHRMYLPLAALAAGVVVLAYRRLGGAAPWVLGLIAIGFAGATFARVQIYQDEIALWQDNVANRPNARAFTALGVALLHAGRPADALPALEHALALDPKNLTAARNRGLVLLQLGRADEAAAVLVPLPARDAGEADEFFALGNAFAREQKFAEAAAAYARTLALDPAHAAAHANLGNIRMLQGRAREAIVEYEAALRLHPDDARVRENLQLARESVR